MASNSSNKKIVIALTCLFLVVGIAVGVIFYRNSQMEPLVTLPNSDAGNEVVSGEGEITATPDEFDILSLPSTMEKDGVTYKLRSDISTFLFLGFDENQYTSYIFLFVLDSTNENIRVLKVPCDYQTTVSVYNDDRQLLKTDTMDIGYQYSYGESNARSSRLTRNLVSEVLKGANIDYCFAISFDGLIEVVDSLPSGTVDVALRNDWTDLNPDYVHDTVLSLDGDGIKEFFDFTGMNKYDDDREHLTRRDWFMLSLFAGLVKTSSSDDLEKVMEAADGAFETDVDVDILKQYKNYELIGSTVVPEENSDRTLDDVLIDMFYLPL